METPSAPNHSDSPSIKHPISKSGQHFPPHTNKPGEPWDTAFRVMPDGRWLRTSTVTAVVDKANRKGIVVAYTKYKDSRLVTVRDCFQPYGMPNVWVPYKRRYACLYAIHGGLAAVKLCWGILMASGLPQIAHLLEPYIEAIAKAHAPQPTNRPGNRTRRIRVPKAQQVIIEQHMETFQNDRSA